MAARERYVVMLGYAGARTALTLAELHREEVQKRFPKHFLKQENQLRRVVECLSELADRTVNERNETSTAQAKLTVRETLQEQGLAEECLVTLEENEVFPALWKLAERMDAGLDVELNKIPMLQFVIEVSELFDANPYVNMTALENRKCFQEIVSDIRKESAEGAESNVSEIYSILIVSEEPEALIAFAEANGLPSAIIGRLTGKNDRVVRNGEIIRYLTPEG